MKAQTALGIFSEKLPVSKSEGSLNLRFYSSIAI